MKLVKTKGAVLVSCAALLLVGCGTDGPEAQSADLEKPTAGAIKKGALDGLDVTFVGFGGAQQEAMSKAFLEPFAKQSGVEVTQTTSDGSAKIQAMVDANNVTYDVVYGNYQWAMAHCGTSVEKLDYSKIDVSEIPKEFQDPCLAPLDLEAAMMVYDSKAFQNDPPSSMEDFFDTEKYPGTRLLPGIQGYPDTQLMDAVWKMMNNDAEDRGPVDIDAVLDKLDTLKPNVRYWSSYAQATQVLDSSNAVMAWVANDAPADANKTGGNWAPVWSACSYLTVSLFIPKGSPHADAAHALINYSLGAKQQGDYISKTPYSPVNPNAKPTYDKATQPFVLNEENRKLCSLQDRQYWADVQEEAAAKWTDWLTH